ncbi:MAG: hypothetical protein HY577_02070 [Candidatus Nealsonbacteria bacterium]|nr:hypothetical protein [Candidatus Nealsonbacteria bacterium]
MLPPGHLGATLILIKTAEAGGGRFSLTEIVLTLAASLVLDLDLLPAQWLKKNHHDLISHTPLGAFILWLILIALYGNHLSLSGQLLILASFFLHLVLDEVGFWLCRLKLQGISREPQITWLYPRVKFPRRKNQEILKPSFLKDYFQKAKANVVSEMILSLMALLMLWLT